MSLEAPVLLYGHDFSDDRHPRSASRWVEAVEGTGVTKSCRGGSRDEDGTGFQRLGPGGLGPDTVRGMEIYEDRTGPGFETGRIGSGVEVSRVGESFELPYLAERSQEEVPPVDPLCSRVTGGPGRPPRCPSALPRVSTPAVFRRTSPDSLPHPPVRCTVSTTPVSTSPP